MKSKAKKWLIIGIVVVLLLGGAAAAWMLLPGMVEQEPVYVYGFMDGIAGMSNYYEGGRESSGMVTTDRIQSVFLSDTQTITEVLVSEGQQVKKGDVLLTYDTTLSDIALKKKEHSVQQAKLDLETAKQELRVINSYVPIAYHPVEIPEVEQPVGPDKQIAELVLDELEYLVYSGEGTTTLTPKYCWLRSDAMLDETVITELFADHTEDSLYIIFQQTEEDLNTGAITDEFGVKLIRLTTPAVTDKDGAQIQPEEVTYRISFYDPSKIGQYTGPIDDGIEWNSGYTSEQIYQMRVAKQEQIDQMEFSIKMAEAEYSIMCKEADNGQVIAEFDGVIQGLLDEESARMMGMPLMKLTGGGGYYVTGTVSELELDSVEVGQNVDVMSWDTGMMHEGTIVEIQQFPQEQEDGYYYGVSQNVSYYPYKVFIDGSAQLRDGFYVSMTLRAEQQEEGSLYLENAFLRTEGASNYVYVRGEDGLLEKRKIQVGGSLWGSYTKILSGLTETDYVAFPYGKQVKEGAPTMEGTWENLYGY